MFVEGRQEPEITSYSAVDRAKKQLLTCLDSLYDKQIIAVAAENPTNTSSLLLVRGRVG